MIIYLILVYSMLINVSFGCEFTIEEENNQQQQQQQQQQLDLLNQSSSQQHQQSSLNPSNNQTYGCESICPRLKFKGQCQCTMLKDKLDVRLDCSHTNAIILMSDIEKFSQCNQPINLIELSVRDSNLTHLNNLPSGLYNIPKLVLDNTGIDLEILRESQELLRLLKILRISNENFTEIPEKLFTPMEELKQLSLNKLGLAYINVDAFESLEDSLKLLELRSNRIRTIPTAVQSLSHLECLDLSGNDIKSVSDRNPVIFSTGLKRLKRLRINPMNCTCEFGKSKFATWLRTYAIKGVHCSWPERLMEKDVSNTAIEEFCEPWPSSSTTISNHFRYNCCCWWWLYQFISILLILYVGEGL